MSQYIMNGMLYDTQKAEKICSGTIEKPLKIFGRPYGSITYDAPIDLYKTPKGNYFGVMTGNYDEGCTLTVEKAKEIMMHNAYEQYCKEFGQLPEA